MSEHISVVTANTHMTEALHDPASVALFAEHDVVMLQESLLSEGVLADIFADTSLTPIISSEGMGLAILAHENFAVRSLRKVVLDKPGKPLTDSSAIDPDAVGNVRLRARGLLSADIELESGASLTVATTHPTVPLKVRARHKQLRALARALPLPSQPLVLGGDMNHWPSPRNADRRFRSDAQLQDAIEDITFDVSHTSYAALGHLARLGIPINGQLDALLYRGPLFPAHVSVHTIASDHRAISAVFEFEP